MPPLSRQSAGPGSRWWPYSSRMWAVCASAGVRASREVGHPASRSATMNIDSFVMWCLSLRVRSDRLWCVPEGDELLRLALSRPADAVAEADRLIAGGVDARL